MIISSFYPPPNSKELRSAVKNLAQSYGFAAMQNWQLEMTAQKNPAQINTTL